MTMIATSCSRCGKEVLIRGGWTVEHAGTLAKRTKVKDSGVLTFGLSGYLVNVDVGLYLPEGQVVYKKHECKEENK